MPEIFTDTLRGRTEFGKKGGENGAYAVHYIDKINLCYENSASVTSNINSTNE